MILIYDRGDLIERSKEKNIREIEFSDIRFSMQSVQLAHVVIFVDQNKGLMRVLKHRCRNDFDPKGVFDSKELIDVVSDGMVYQNSLGKSMLMPGTRKRRE